VVQPTLGPAPGLSGQGVPRSFCNRGCRVSWHHFCCHQGLPPFTGGWGSTFHDFTLPTETPQFHFGSTSMLLQPWLIQPPTTEVTYDAYIKCVMIITTAKGACFYVGIISQLQFDPGRWRRACGVPLMAYSMQIGRKLMNPHHQLTRSIPEKWHGLLPMTYQPRWCDIWNKRRPQKEAGFLWSVLHCAVAVNSWQAQMAPGFPISCIYCPAGLDETVIHRFYQCERTRRAWHFALTVLYTHLEIPPGMAGGLP
jgi:hypothetical protein